MQRQETNLDEWIGRSMSMADLESDNGLYPRTRLMLQESW
jgi:hypothetical protein